METNNFPFLNDEITISYIRSSKVIFVMRGLPGSGKSTLVKLLLKVYPESKICSADDYFLQEDGSYEYDTSLLKEAHEQCHSKAEHSCDSCTPTVIIDNTNVRHWEMQFYLDLASRCSYTVVLVTPQTSWCLDPVECAKRNKHHVPVDTLNAKVKLFCKENMNPMYWAWFLNDTGTDKLLHMANSCFELCIKHCPDFKTYFEDTISGAAKAMSFSSLYNRDNASTRTLHCTTYFMGRNGNDDNYTQKVAQFMGQAFTIDIIGLFITQQTAGARVRLTPQQTLLWKNEDDDLCQQLDALDVTDEAKQTEPRFQPLSGVGSRAHITLGCVNGVKAVQTGDDHVELNSFEAQNLQDETFIDVDDMAIRDYGNGRCVVYFNEAIKINCLFSGKY